MKLNVIINSDNSKTITCGAWILARVYPSGDVHYITYYEAPMAMRDKCDDVLDGLRILDKGRA